MDLMDPMKGVSTQRVSISQLLSKRDQISSSMIGLPLWDSFRTSVWGKDRASFQAEELMKRNHVKDIHPPPTPPDSPPFTLSVVTPPKDIPKPWNLSSRQILVRSDYIEAERAALLASKDQDIFVVAGQPGIGLFPLSPPQDLASNV